MLSVDELVAKAKQDGGSDIHLIAGLPPKYRVSGGLENMSEEIISEQDALEYAKVLGGEKVLPP